MQTFLPYADFDMSAQVLDDRRLGNQAYNECYVLVSGGWQNHPASRMWASYENALALFALACLRELESRGRFYPDWIEYYQQAIALLPDTGMPFWLGRPDIHSAYRANLLHKNPDHYGQFGWTETPRQGYVWPV